MLTSAPTLDRMTLLSNPLALATPSALTVEPKLPAVRSALAVAPSSKQQATACLLNKIEPMVREA